MIDPGTVKKKPPAVFPVYATIQPLLKKQGIVIFILNEPPN